MNATQFGDAVSACVDIISHDSKQALIDGLITSSMANLVVGAIFLISGVIIWYYGWGWNHEHVKQWGATSMIIGGVSLSIALSLFLSSVLQ